MFRRHRSAHLGFASSNHGGKNGRRDNDRAGILQYESSAAFRPHQTTRPITHTHIQCMLDNCPAMQENRQGKTGTAHS